jgi:hypothetical protein
VEVASEGGEFLKKAEGEILASSLNASFDGEYDSAEFEKAEAARKAAGPTIAKAGRAAAAAAAGAARAALRKELLMVKATRDAGTALLITSPNEIEKKNREAAEAKEQVKKAEAERDRAVEARARAEAEAGAAVEGEDEAVELLAEALAALKEANLLAEAEGAAVVGALAAAKAATRDRAAARAAGASYDGDGYESEEGESRSSRGVSKSGYANYDDELEDEIRSGQAYARKREAAEEGWRAKFAEESRRRKEAEEKVKELKKMLEKMPDPASILNELVRKRPGTAVIDSRGFNLVEASSRRNRGGRL